MTGPYPLDAIHMTSAEVWQALGVRPDLLRQWIARGHVVKVKRDTVDMGSVVNYLMERGEWEPGRGRTANSG